MSPAIVSVNDMHIWVVACSVSLAYFFEIRDPKATGSAISIDTEIPSRLTCRFCYFKRCSSSRSGAVYFSGNTTVFENICAYHCTTEFGSSFLTASGKHQVDLLKFSVVKCANKRNSNKQLENHANTVIEILGDIQIVNRMNLSDNLYLVFSAGLLITADLKYKVNFLSVMNSRAERGEMYSAACLLESNRYREIWGEAAFCSFTKITAKSVFKCACDYMRGSKISDCCFVQNNIDSIFHFEPKCTIFIYDCVFMEDDAVVADEDYFESKWIRYLKSEFTKWDANSIISSCHFKHIETGNPDTPSFCEYTKISHTHTPTLEPISRNMYRDQTFYKVDGPDKGNNLLILVGFAVITLLFVIAILLGIKSANQQQQLHKLPQALRKAKVADANKED